MTFSLNQLQISHCSNFLDHLSFLEENLQTPEFGNALENLHQSFLALSASFEISSPFNIVSLENPDEFGIQKLKINQITLSLHNDIVLDISERYNELAFHFVGKHKNEVINEIEFFHDYEKRCCDFCGLYFRKPDFEAPMFRKQMDNFIFAYHLSCYKDLNI